jgi:hypothetical protein
MVIFVIVMIGVALFAARGFIIANRSPAPVSSEPPKPRIQPAREVVAPPAPDLKAPDLTTTDEDIVSYLPAEIPALLTEVLVSVPLATVEEAMMGCYGTMGFTETQRFRRGEQSVRPFQTNSLEELISRTSTAIGCMEQEQPISKFTISTHKKSKTNPHVDLFAHSVEPKRIRLIRFWRTQDAFVTTLAN